MENQTIDKVKTLEFLIDEINRNVNDRKLKLTTRHRAAMLLKEYASECVYELAQRIIIDEENKSIDEIADELISEIENGTKRY